MFNWFKKPPTSEGFIIQRLKELLFPNMELHKAEGKTFHVDYSVDKNLEAVLWDLEEGVNNEVTRANVKYCLQQLTAARQYVNPKVEWNPEAEYLVIGHHFDKTGWDTEIKD